MCGCPLGALYVQNQGWGSWVTQSLNPLEVKSIKKEYIVVRNEIIKKKKTEDSRFSVKVLLCPVGSGF